MLIKDNQFSAKISKLIVEEKNKGNTHSTKFLLELYGECSHSDENESKVCILRQLEHNQEFKPLIDQILD